MPVSLTIMAKEIPVQEKALKVKYFLKPQIHMMGHTKYMQNLLRIFYLLSLLGGNRDHLGPF